MHGPDHHDSVVAADGRLLTIRPIRPDDRRRLQAFHRRLSRRTQRLRFFTSLRQLPDAMASHFVNVDFRDRAAFVAVCERDDAIHAVGRFDRTGDDEAEVAFVVEDRYQGQGVGSLLFWRLVECAKEHGITRFVANVLAENDAMLSLFRRTGLPLEVTYEAEQVRVTLDLRPAL